MGLPAHQLTWEIYSRPPSAFSGLLSGLPLLRRLRRVLPRQARCIVGESGLIPGQGSCYFMGHWTHFNAVRRACCAASVFIDWKTVKAALVTGANRGIGLAASAALARLGMLVFLTGGDEGRAEEAAATLQSDGLNVRALRLDVTDQASVDMARERVEKEVDHLDVLNRQSVQHHGLAQRPAKP
jgi:short chain dehydrogenase